MAGRGLSRPCAMACTVALAAILAVNLHVASGAAALHTGNEFPIHNLHTRANVANHHKVPTKTVRKVYNFTEDITVKGVSVHDDIYTEVVFLRHILNFIVLPGDGSASRPARSCRSLMISHPNKINGFYYIDPNGGDSDDKLHAYCNFTGGGWTVLEPQVRRSKIDFRVPRYGLKGYDNYTWYSTMDKFFKVDYPRTTQLRLLQAQSKAVRQVLVFRCMHQTSGGRHDILPPFFDGRSDTAVKLQGQDNVAFKADGSSAVKVDVLRNDCDEYISRGRSILRLGASNADMEKLPITDFALHDMNPSDQMAVRLNKATLMYL